VHRPTRAARGARRLLSDPLAPHRRRHRDRRHANQASRKPMNAYEEAPGIDLPDERVAVCGDWHGNLQWVSTLTRALTSLAPDVKTILQVGDWWMDPAASDRVFAE